MYQVSQEGGFGGYDRLGSSDSTPRATQHIVDELSPSTKYFIRLQMEVDNESKCAKTYDLKNSISKAVHQKGFYQSCSFWTLPNENSDLNQTFSQERHQMRERTEGSENNVDEVMVTDTHVVSQMCAPFRLHCVHANFLPGAMPSFHFNQGVPEEITDVPQLTCIIGDPVAAPIDATQIQQEKYSIDTWKLYTQNIALKSNLSLLRNSSLVLAWNDSRFGSDVDMRAEEVAYKRHSHDLKKYKKKYGKNSKHVNSKAPPPPTLVRPHVSRSLLSLTTALPITYSENSSVRHVYKTMMIGSGML